MPNNSKSSETPDEKVIRVPFSDKKGTGNQSNHRRKMLAEKSAFALFRLLSGVIVTILFVILAFIIIKGAAVINWDFITTPPADGMKSGGIWPAILFTLWWAVRSSLSLWE